MRQRGPRRGSGRRLRVKALLLLLAVLALLLLELADLLLLRGELRRLGLHSAPQLRVRNLRLALVGLSLRLLCLRARVPRALHHAREVRRLDERDVRPHRRIPSHRGLNSLLLAIHSRLLLLLLLTHRLRDSLLRGGGKGGLGLLLRLRRRLHRCTCRARGRAASAALLADGVEVAAEGVLLGSHLLVLALQILARCLDLVGFPLQLLGILGVELAGDVRDRRQLLRQRVVR
mmetsp:Transcript_35724/g.84790  ORF Transcript_35724/g.84790 Transcript_35724/m.84790 type:complete len:232 (-) Transcript_35724:312-1007(-)